MERATQKDERGYYLVGDGIYSDEGTPEKFRGDDVDRLAAYEDTGLEPCDYSAMAHALEQAERAREDLTEMIRQIGATGLDRLRELAQADQEGKIPKYTIDDTIYDRFGDAWEVRTAELHLLGEKPDWMYRCGHAGTDDYCALWSFEILTSEEAQAALRREKLMANKPVIGYQVCPYCGGKVPVIWDGNRKETCMYCKKRFQLKRQKLKNTMRVNCPPEGEVGMVKYIGNGGDQNGATDI